MYILINLDPEISPFENLITTFDHLPSDQEVLRAFVEKFNNPYVPTPTTTVRHDGINFVVESEIPNTPHRNTNHLQLFEI